MNFLWTHWSISDRVADPLPGHREFGFEEAVRAIRWGAVWDPLERPDALIDHASHAPPRGFRDRVLNVGLFRRNSESRTSQAKANAGMTDQTSPSKHRLTASDKGHLRSHDRDELDIRFQGQVGHEGDLLANMVHVHPGLDSHLTVRLHLAVR